MVWCRRSARPQQQLSSEGRQCMLLCKGCMWLVAVGGAARLRQRLTVLRHPSHAARGTCGTSGRARVCTQPT